MQQDHSYQQLKVKNQNNCKLTLVCLTNDQLKTDTTEVSSSDRFIQCCFDETIIEWSDGFPEEFTEEHDQEDVAGGDGDTWYQSHPAADNRTNLMQFVIVSILYALEIFTLYQQA